MGTLKNATWVASTRSYTAHSQELITKLHTWKSNGLLGSLALALALLLARLERGGEGGRGGERGGGGEGRRGEGRGGELNTSNCTYNVKSSWLTFHLRSRLQH